ncbi:MAG: type II toxin-antitoxin system RatA family toxin [Alphaproteobacteria bacterium]|nr:type II toxin-antitoxin system RatA family toxin [Alphaproteobacteria bacterium]
MPLHSEQKILHHSADQMYHLVMDVEKYPDFLPWCLGCEIISRDNTTMVADLLIGYKLYREKFTSKVTTPEPHVIYVEYIRGPLKYLHNQWKFTKINDEKCMVDFYVDFEFKNPFFEKFMGLFFDEIVRRMVQAFVKRADEIYRS